MPDVNAPGLTGVKPQRAGETRKRWSTPRVIMATLASRGVGVKPTNVPDTSANATEHPRGGS